MRSVPDGARRQRSIRSRRRGRTDRRPQIALTGKMVARTEVAPRASPRPAPGRGSSTASAAAVSAQAREPPNSARPPRPAGRRPGRPTVGPVTQADGRAGVVGATGRAGGRRGQDQAVHHRGPGGRRDPRPGRGVPAVSLAPGSAVPSGEGAAGWLSGSSSYAAGFAVAGGRPPAAWMLEVPAHQGDARGRRRANTAGHRGPRQQIGRPGGRKISAKGRGARPGRPRRIRPPDHARGAPRSRPGRADPAVTGACPSCRRWRWAGRHRQQKP